MSINDSESYLKRYEAPRLVSQEQAAALGIEVARAIGIDVDQDLTIPLSTEPETAAPRPPTSPTIANRLVASARQRIVGGGLVVMNVIFNRLDAVVSVFRQETQRIDAEIEGINVTIDAASIKQREAVRALADTRARIAASGQSAVRKLPTFLYIPLIVVAGLFVAFLNIATFQIFREGVVITTVAALFYGGVYVFAVHQIGLGLTDETHWRQLRFWSAVGLLVALTFGTLALAAIRADYLHALHKPSQSWTFLALQLVADCVGIVAAIFHANPRADEFHQATRAREIAWQNVEELHAARAEREHAKTELREQGATEAAQHLQDVDTVGQLQLDALATFQMALFSRLDPALEPQVEAIDLRPTFPGERSTWRAWLAQECQSLGRPSPPVDPPALGSGNAA